MFRIKKSPKPTHFDNFILVERDHYFTILFTVIHYKFFTKNFAFYVLIVFHHDHHFELFNWHIIQSVNSFFSSFFFFKQSHTGVIFYILISIARSAGTICFVNSPNLSIRQNHTQGIYKRNPGTIKSPCWFHSKKNYPRPDQLFENLSEKIRKFRRSISAEPLSNPVRWVIDITFFRQSIKQFKNNFTAIQYHEEPTVTKIQKNV